MKARVVKMNEPITTKLSDKAIKLLLGECESKIKNCEASLEDYDLFVKCQRELLKRQSKELSERYIAFF
jgi:hypothetical protein